MSYVDTKKVLETAKDGYHSDFEENLANLTSLREVLEDTPTADVVEVIRCRYCKHLQREQEPAHGKTMRFCPILKIEVFPDFYCYHGKRKIKKG